MICLFRRRVVPPHALYDPAVPLQFSLLTRGPDRRPSRRAVSRSPARTLHLPGLTPPPAHPPARPQGPLLKETYRASGLSGTRAVLTIHNMAFQVGPE